MSNGFRSELLNATLVALCVGVTLLAGCGEEEGTPTGSTCPDASTLTYESFGQAFMAANCLSCHAGAESPNLATLAAIQQNAALIDRTAAAGPKATNTIMPENVSVAASERTKLGEWLACGAP